MICFDLIYIITVYQKGNDNLKYWLPWIKLYLVAIAMHDNLYVPLIINDLVGQSVDINTYQHTHTYQQKSVFISSVPVSLPAETGASFIVPLYCQDDNDWSWLQRQSWKRERRGEKGDKTKWSDWMSEGKKNRRRVQGKDKGDMSLCLRKRFGTLSPWVLSSWGSSYVDVFCYTLQPCCILTLSRTYKL